MGKDKNKTAVVILSGGMDSAVLLYYLHNQKYELRTLGIDYGQKHYKELVSARKIASSLGVPFTIADLCGLKALLSNSSQTSDDIAVPHGHYEEESMRLTVVPNRNMILLSVAIGYAVNIGFDQVGYAAHAGDHAIYPDCRPAFADAVNVAGQLCHYTPVSLLRPFMDKTKGDLVALGLELGVPFELTWTCYEGKERACGECGACQERLEAFKQCGVGDPIGYKEGIYT